MKSILLIAFTLLVSTASSAQWELYGAKVDGDTVKVWNTNISLSCNAKLTAATKIVKDSIIIIEQDTSTQHAKCICFYDVNVALTGLSSASYRVVIYRTQLKKYQYANDTTILVASFSFSTGSASNITQITKVVVTDCHQMPLTVEESQGGPGTMALLASYPNPFNPMTTISFTVPESEHVKLEVFDAMGKCVAVLMDEKKTVGEYRVQFDGRSFASGVYLCRFQAGATVLTNKLILLK
ncbi:MAG TPA: T9SS type A sorting domain-containing protein [Nitrosomonas sp.]|nr:T9SS type A sorting domain-containing protein [Nitrosomonas sp.]